MEPFSRLLTTVLPLTTKLLLLMTVVAVGTNLITVLLLYVQCNLLCNMLLTVLLLYVQCNLLWQEPSRTSWEAGDS